MGVRGLDLLSKSEPEMIVAFDRFIVGRPGHFVDVGANIGQTLVALKTVDPSRPYVGFEPNSIACGYVQDFVRINQFADATVMPLALGFEHHFAQLHLGESSIDSNASFRTGNRRAGIYTSAMFAVVERGDEALSRLGVVQVAAIKIDTEGTELEVLQGLELTIAANRPVIFMEILPPLQTLSREANQQRIEVALGAQDWAASHKYSIHALSANGNTVQVSDMQSHLEHPTGRNFVLTALEW